MAEYPCGHVSGLERSESTRVELRNMRARDLLRQLNRLAPGFAEFRESAQTESGDDDGHCSLHGVCGDFSHFYRRHYELMSVEAKRELFDFIEFYLVEPEAEETPVDNALCTSLLENIAAEPCGEDAQQYMGSKSRAFFGHWHSGPPYS